MRIKTITRKITPEVGVKLAGYGPDDVSVAIHDDLLISGMLFDDGAKRALLLSYDLLGIDACNIQRIRQACAAKTALQPGDIVLTCTHTHAGPHTRTSPGMPLNAEYIERLVQESVAAAAELCSGETVEVDVLHYSSTSEESVNRRVPQPDGSCRSLFRDRKALLPFATGVTDDELALLLFLEKGTSNTAALLVNYAAHPLSGHAAGRMALTISADYPGVIRGALAEMGVACVFTSGACGDMSPRDFEAGFERTREMGLSIAREIVKSCADAIHHRPLHTIPAPRLKTSSVMVELGMRQTPHKRLPLYAGMEKVSLELQFLALGDVCFVGVPGELLAEPGLEIKWHSPFRKTFILYNSTAYISYLCHANAFVGGGYEADTAQVEPRATLKLVNAAVDELFKLKDEEHPR